MNAQNGGLRAPVEPRVSEERMEQLLEDRVLWCCEGRHGYVMGLTTPEADEMNYTLEYYYGCKPNRGSWWQKEPDGTYNVEFCHQAKVYPPPNRPWGWCGETDLFSDWKARELQQAVTKSRFQMGDRVRFAYRGQTFEGIIAGGRKRATVIAGHRKFYMPYSYLTKI